MIEICYSQRIQIANMDCVDASSPKLPGNFYIYVFIEIVA